MEEEKGEMPRRLSILSGRVVGEWWVEETSGVEEEEEKTEFWGDVIG